MTDIPNDSNGLGTESFIQDWYLDTLERIEPINRNRREQFSVWESYLHILVLFDFSGGLELPEMELCSPVQFDLSPGLDTKIPKYQSIPQISQVQSDLPASPELPRLRSGRLFSRLDNFGHLAGPELWRWDPDPDICQSSRVQSYHMTAQSDTTTGPDMEFSRYLSRYRPSTVRSDPPASPGPSRLEPYRSSLDIYRSSLVQSDCLAGPDRTESYLRMETSGRPEWRLSPGMYQHDSGFDERATSEAGTGTTRPITPTLFVCSNLSSILDWIQSRIDQHHSASESAVGEGIFGSFQWPSAQKTYWIMTGSAIICIPFGMVLQQYKVAIWGLVAYVNHYIIFTFLRTDDCRTWTVWVIACGCLVRANIDQFGMVSR